MHRWWKQFGWAGHNQSTFWPLWDAAISGPQTALSPHTLQSEGTCPPKFAPFLGGPGFQRNTWFLGPAQVHNPNSISIGSAVLQGSRLCPTDRQTHRQTDQLTPSYIDSNRPQIMLCMAMRPKNKPYEDRLKHLNLPNMKYRCIRGEMIEEMINVHNIYDSRVLPYTFLQFKR